MMGMSIEEVLAFNGNVIADFRANDGVMPEGSMFHGNPTLLMTMVGAKSVTVELPGETFEARATETEGTERERVFEVMTTRLPRFAEYQDKTSTAPDPPQTRRSL